MVAREKDFSFRSQMGGDAQERAATGSEPSAAFTLGPWRVSDGEGSDFHVVAPDHTLSDPWSDPWNVAVVVGACGYPSDPRTGTTTNNARLIAAAPELYEAAKAAKTLLVPDLNEPGRTVFWKLVDALAKAEGK